LIIKNSLTPPLSIDVSVPRKKSELPTEPLSSPNVSDGFYFVAQSLGTRIHYVIILSLHFKWKTTCLCYLFLVDIVLP
jgi:hypothetical protein